MPSMADITVKKADGTTDVVYAALTPAAGDKTPARWSLTAASTKANLRPTYESSSRFNGPKTARAIDLTLKFPEVVSVSSVDTIIGTAHVAISGVIPLQMSDAAIAEAVAQAANLFKSTLIQASVKAGYSPQ